jgi:hypothetical protein
MANGGEVRHLPEVLPGEVEVVGADELGADAEERDVRRRQAAVRRPIGRHGLVLLSLLGKGTPKRQPGRAPRDSPRDGDDDAIERERE